VNSLMRYPQRQIGVVEPASSEETTPLPDTALGDELALSAPKLLAGSCPGGRVRLPRLGLRSDRRLRVTGARCEVEAADHVEVKRCPSGGAARRHPGCQAGRNPQQAGRNPQRKKGQ
jgi:hypothetical protein